MQTSGKRKVVVGGVWGGWWTGRDRKMDSSGPRGQSLIAALGHRMGSACLPNPLDRLV